MEACVCEYIGRLFLFLNKISIESFGVISCMCRLAKDRTVCRKVSDSKAWIKLIILVKGNFHDS